jgi:hypothetical protein
MTYLKFVLQTALVLAAAHGDVALSGRADRNPVVAPMTIADLIPAASDAIPKPGSSALILVGLIGVGAIARRRLSSRA